MPSRMEMRRDDITGRETLFAPERSERPLDFTPESLPSDSAHCPFCRGREAQTPGEILARRAAGSQADDPDWRIRVVPNRYPAVGDLDRMGAAGLGGAPLQEALPGDVGGEACFGRHEVVIESPEHHTSFANLTPHAAAETFHVSRERLEQLAGDRRLAAAALFKNSGGAAGASLAHLHSQIVALPFVPAERVLELRAAEAFHRARGRCAYCERVRRESVGPRRVAETRELVAFCPFASRFAWETWIVPRRHESRFERAEEAELDGLGGMARAVVAALERVISPLAFNWVLRTAPFAAAADGHEHWRLEILPRTARLAGFELGGYGAINGLFPEDAAAQLRAAL